MSKDIKSSGQEVTNELLQAMLSATDAQKRAALAILRGEQVEQVEMPEPYLSLREVGRRLGLSPCSLWRWRVPGHELGGRRRFKISEVQAYLESPAFRRRSADLKRQRREVKKDEA